MPATGNSGPPGQPRGVAFVIILSIITLGIYSLYWDYKTFEEMKQHTGDGLGGVVGLVIAILIGIVNFFVIASEVGKSAPISGWAGLWLLLPFVGVIVWFVKVQGSLNRYWQGKRALAPAV